METSLLALGAVLLGGALVGVVARPVSWRLVVGVLILGVMFVVLEVARTLWIGLPPESLIGIVALSNAAETSSVGAIAIAYAAFIGAVIIAVRVALVRKQQTHEP
jgi:hypothetical protein